MKGFAKRKTGTKKTDVRAKLLLIQVHIDLLVNESQLTNRKLSECAVIV